MYLNGILQDIPYKKSKKKLNLDFEKLEESLYRKKKYKEIVILRMPEPHILKTIFHNHD